MNKVVGGYHMDGSSPRSKQRTGHPKVAKPSPSNNPAIIMPCPQCTEAVLAKGSPTRYYDDGTKLHEHQPERQRYKMQADSLNPTKEFRP